MKQWIIVISVLLLIYHVSGAAKVPDNDSDKTLDKASEKMYPKKVTSEKKKLVKSQYIKSPLDAFKDLPEEDLEFIKELDKQFKLHGDKIKIKVERDNSTLKNAKRTVEGDLGYGYYNGQQSAGYDYSKPAFSFYPYSQQDIPASAPGYQIKDEEQSTVTIIPSYSYEIKQTSNAGYETNSPFVPSQPHPEQQQGNGYQYNEPVIVLKIPGPTKYASHLQVLLQQYLEIRAAQYLKLFEEAELQKQQQQQQQQLHQQNDQQLQYEQVPEKAQAISYQQQSAPQNYEYAEHNQQINYPAIDEVYQNYKGRHTDTIPIQEQQYEGPAQYAQQQGGNEGQQQQYYYMQVHEQQQPSQAAAGVASVEQGYRPIYYVAMPQSEYGHPDVHASPVPQGYIDDARLPITENSPRQTHTKVAFTDGENTDHSTHYPLPSIKPFERHAPTPVPTYEPYQVDPHGESAYYEQQQYQLQGQATNADPVVSITQRPYNFHAHSMRAKNSKRNANASPAPASTPSGENLKKLHTLINRLRAPENETLRRIKKETA